MKFWSVERACRYAEGVLQEEYEHEAFRSDLGKTMVELPIPMILMCRGCGRQHVDRDEWATRLHRSHLCAYCGQIWRPADVPTVGVRYIETKGERDTYDYRGGEPHRCEFCDAGLSNTIAECLREVEAAGKRPGELAGVRCPNCKRMSRV